MNLHRLPLILTLPLLALLFWFSYLEKVAQTVPDPSVSSAVTTGNADGLIGKLQGRFEQDFLMMRDPATGDVPYHRLTKARQIADQKRTLAAQMENTIPIYWEERGPNNVGGRSRGLIFDANDPSQQTVWAGGVAGGLWRTTNIDAANPNWQKIDDFFDNLAISSIAQDPSNPNNIYFGTGESWGNFDAVRGFGIWASTDGGNTWNQMPSTTGNAFRLVSKVVVDASGTLFAATRSGMFRYNPGPDTWTKVLGLGAFANTDFVTDVEIAANGDMYAATSLDGIYRSTNNGTNWNPVMNGLPNSGFGRVELACAPGNAAVVYVIFADTAAATSGNCLSVFRTTNNGGNWTARTCPANFGSQAWYDLILAVDPNDQNRIWAGGVGLFVSGDGGNNWTSVPGIHVDHHAIVYRPGNSDQMVFGNDGGIYRCLDGSAAVPTMIDKNLGYNVTQFYALALHPDAGSNYMLGGTQDNATPKFTSAGLAGTSCVLCCCDGGWAFIDQGDPMIQIGSTQNGSFNLSTDGGNTFPTNIVPGNNNRIFITPADYDDSSNVLYVSDSTNTFIRVTDVGGANTLTRETTVNFGNSTVTAITASPNTNNRVFFGTSNGTMVRVDNADQNGATNPTPLASPGPTSWISSIEVQRGNDNHLLVTFSNFGVTSVYESIDGGTSWTNVEGDLPDMPVRWALFHPFDSSQAIVATELGVWSTEQLDGANTIWSPTNNYGMANVRTDMLQIRTSDWLVGAATHGRGMYTTDYFTMLQDCPPSLVLSGNIPSGIYMASEFITSDGSIQPGEKVIYHAGEYIELLPDFEALDGSDFWAVIRPCRDVDTTNFNDPIADVEEPQLDTEDTSNGEIRQNGEQEMDKAGAFSFNAYPNPVDYLLQVDYQIPEEGYVHVFIRDAQGRLKETLISNVAHPAGRHRVRLDAQGYEAGLYFITFVYAENVLTDKFFVVK